MGKRRDSVCVGAQNNKNFDFWKDVNFQTHTFEYLFNRTIISSSLNQEPKPDNSTLLISYNLRPNIM